VIAFCNVIMAIFFGTQGGLLIRSPSEIFQYLQSTRLIQNEDSREPIDALEIFEV
jgi:hypothetical protein